jgi:hypothetical protein
MDELGYNCREFLAFTSLVLSLFSALAEAQGFVI